MKTDRRTAISLSTSSSSPSPSPASPSFSSLRHQQHQHNVFFTLFCFTTLFFFFCFTTTLVNADFVNAKSNRYSMSLPLLPTSRSCCSSLFTRFFFPLLHLTLTARRLLLFLQGIISLVVGKTTTTNRFGFVLLVTKPTSTKVVTISFLGHVLLLLPISLVSFTKLASRL
jgi:hypothetical protein